MWHAALALLVLAAEPAPEDAFRWLDPGADTPLLRQVESAFRKELKPDDPAATAAQGEVPALWRFVDRVGLVGSHALVLVGNQETRGDVDGARFDAWNLDLATGRKERIRTGDALFQWHFRGLASFEPSAVPDVVFQYHDCWECESTLSLASFRFDERDGRWHPRCWLHFGKEVDFVEILKATRYDEDDDVRYEFRHAVRDVTGDGFADVVVERVDTGVTTRKTNRRTTVNTYVDGNPVARPPTDEERAAVEAALSPGGPLAVVAEPRRGRYRNARFGYAVAFPAEFAAVPPFEDSDWADGIFVPLPGGPHAASQPRGRGIRVLGSENVWVPDDPERPPRPEPVPPGVTRRRSKTRTTLAGLPGWRVVTRTEHGGTETIEDTVRLFRRFEPDRPGESDDACWTHFFRYELTLSSPATTYAEDRRVFDGFLASFRFLPLP